MTDGVLDRADDVYNALIEMHEGLTPEQSQVVDAKLILLLVNHVGDFEVLREAIALARQGI
ncbi:MAG TPA: DUF2783 domain-containing protein [Candidatus Binatia bacterium]|nr:DUF2783 domain-containing protein [Candidatus Binatia bacterium]